MRGSCAAGSSDNRIDVDRLAHDPDMCAAVFRKDHAQSKKLKRDDDSS
jgi:hypothetical protein